VKIECHCGALIIDQTDALSNKAHFIPDQDWDRVLEALETDIVDAVAGRRLTREGAYHGAREIVSRSARGMWQCSACGRLYVDDPERKLHCFAPETAEADRRVLRGGGNG
jgi:hypothetical protein